MANNLGQYIPLALLTLQHLPAAPRRLLPITDVIAVVQHREQMHSSWPGADAAAAKYVQQLYTPANASWSKHVALDNEMLDGTLVPALLPNGTQAYAVDNPHYLGPVIAATKDRPVRIVFYNLLPTGAEGDLFLTHRLQHDGLGVCSINQLSHGPGHRD